MCVALEHRGPDARGLHVSAGAGLGIQRLRVIDLATGDQPIYNEDRIIVGRPQRRDLQLRASCGANCSAHGHTLATNGDTEVIVHLYEEYGDDCVAHLHGMFAFALWDAARRRLLLARDRVGKKPLFYCAARRRAVLRLRARARCCATPRSRARSITSARRLSHLPATSLRRLSAFAGGAQAAARRPSLTWDDGGSDVARYWSLDYAAKRPVSRRASCTRRSARASARRVRRRLMADVPLGAFLSGGIDSTAVVAAMARSPAHRSRRSRSASTTPPSTSCRYARAVAEHFGTEHHELRVEPRRDRDPAADRPPLRRAVRRLARRSRAFTLGQLTRRARDRRAQRRRRRRDLRRLLASTVHTLLMRRFDRLPGWLRRAAAALGGHMPTSGADRQPAERIRIA